MCSLCFYRYVDVLDLHRPDARVVGLIDHAIVGLIGPEIAVSTSLEWVLASAEKTVSTEPSHQGTGRGRSDDERIFPPTKQLLQKTHGGRSNSHLFVLLWAMQAILDSFCVIPVRY